MWHFALVFNKKTKSEGVKITDVPFTIRPLRHSVPHDDIKKYVELARAYSRRSLHCLLWAQDLACAYRQFPVERPEDCYMVLNTSSRPLIFRHRALPFGSTASVWAFNRSADALTYLARRMLLVTTGQYVDYWAAAEQSSTVESGCKAFEDTFKCLGLRMKPKEAQPPQDVQKILGVEIEVNKTNVTLKPHEFRRSYAWWTQRYLKTILTLIKPNALQARPCFSPLRCLARLIDLPYSLYMDEPFMNTTGVQHATSSTVV